MQALTYAPFPCTSRLLQIAGPVASASSSEVTCQGIDLMLPADSGYASGRGEYWAGGVGGGGGFLWPQLKLGAIWEPILHTPAEPGRDISQYKALGRAPPGSSVLATMPSHW